jgi:serine/threonine protein kinase
MKAGIFLSKGSYGCVYSPPINCDKKSLIKYDESFVGKIFGKDNDMIDEKKQYDILRKVDPKSEFTVKLQQSCAISLKNFSASDLKKSTCKLRANQKYHQIIMKRGITIDEYYKKRSFKISTDIHKMMNLVDGLIQFSKHKLIHRDIKPDNLIHMNDKFYFIDYGMMTTFNKVFSKTELYLMKASYIYFPPEFLLYTTNQLNTYVSNIPTSIKNLLSRVNVSSTNELDKELNNLLEIKITAKKPQRDVNKIDIFSFGITFLQMMSNYRSEEYAMNSLHQDFVIILKRCISFNVNERCTAIELKKMFKSFINFYYTKGIKPVSLRKNQLIHKAFFEIK